ncbi:MAG: hypothetical protein AAF530_25400 [Pseudomonadota bacterium]
MTSIAILSTDRLPKFLGKDHPNEDSLFAEDDRLAEAFAARGAAARRIAWRDKTPSWRDFDLVLIRSTWDYIDHCQSFLAVLREIEDSGCRLFNPLTTVRWNLSKSYLGALAAQGLPVVPTQFLCPKTAVRGEPPLIPDFAKGYVVKPLVGVGGFGTERVLSLDDLGGALEKRRQEDQVIIQPFLPSIQEEGEWSFVFGSGRFLYAALKRPKDGDFRVQVMYGAHTSAQSPQPSDLAAAQNCFRALPVPVCLARMDLARMPDGHLALMEAELIEPQLYLHDLPHAADLLADAVLETLRSQSATSP